MTRIAPQAVQHRCGRGPSAGGPLTCRGGPNQPVAEPHAGGHLGVRGSQVVAHQLQQQQQEHADQPQPRVARPACRRTRVTPRLRGGPRRGAHSRVCFLLFPELFQNCFQNSVRARARAGLGDEAPATAAARLPAHVLGRRALGAPCASSVPEGSLLMAYDALHPVGLHFCCPQEAAPHPLQDGVREPPAPCGFSSGKPGRSEGEEGTSLGLPTLSGPQCGSQGSPLYGPALGDSFPPPARELSWVLSNSSRSISCSSLYPAGPLAGTPPPRRNPTTSSDRRRPSLGHCTAWWPLPSPRPVSSPHVATRLGEGAVCLSVTWSLSTAAPAAHGSHH